MIVIDEFIWLPQIVEKLLSKHQVSPEEVEEVFFNRPKVRFHEKDMWTVKTCIRRWDRAMRAAI